MAMMELAESDYTGMVTQQRYLSLGLVNQVISSSDSHTFHDMYKEITKTAAM